MYDPLRDKNPGCNAPYPASYWAELGQDRASCPALQQNCTADVVVIGAGYTGLNAARVLAERFSQQVVVLEAHQPGWGCSGRNAGFVLKGTGRLGAVQLTERFGLETAQACYREYRQAFEQVATLCQQGAIDCQAQSPGYYKLAHQPRFLPLFEQQQQLLNQYFGEQLQYLSQAELQQAHLADQQACGALLDPDCFGLNPLQLALGYSRLAEQAGATIYGGSPVLGWQTLQGLHRLQTPEGSVTAKKVLIATNGYTPKDFHPLLNGRILPVQSSIIVTRPLTAAERNACGFRDQPIVMDTRALKYYYRLLPDGRLLFGGRGAIQGRDADKPRYQQALLAAMCRSFPALNGIGIDHQWSGWVAVSLDDMPHLYQAPKDSCYAGVSYAAGYCGSGLSFSALAGQRLAEQAMGQSIPNLPCYQRPLPAFPFAPWRRLGQWLYYQWGRWQDQRP
ncbi:NAD(P)/FAD-dependent oxidoreductase [Alkalimonas amylolytica]|uniref:Glycine/D-amino acid oxidase n=1 Tax=Alkalimonas amylolytica TaxID=152573 RepID=A0A1H3XS52_ALKAM|nr:FAD-binding oxidoreductase [Alkalimonas amylolytica]SEA01348.1 Glycine/D-amino acid oxidase [Alkalimonas amylolytica]